MDRRGHVGIVRGAVISGHEPGGHVHHTHGFFNGTVLPGQGPLGQPIVCGSAHGLSSVHVFGDIARHPFVEGCCVCCSTRRLGGGQLQLLTQQPHNMADRIQLPRQRGDEFDDGQGGREGSTIGDFDKMEDLERQAEDLLVVVAADEVGTVIAMKAGEEEAREQMMRIGDSTVGRWRPQMHMMALILFISNHGLNCSNQRR